MSKKGISLIVLMITIVVVIILTSVVIVSATNVVIDVKKKQFAKEIYSVQKAVEKYYYENNKYPYKVDSNNKNEEIKVTPLTENISQFTDEDMLDGTVTLYPIDLQEAGIQELSRGINKNSNANDVYAFSSKTGKVYYVKGAKIGGVIYYTLIQELKQKIGLKITD